MATPHHCYLAISKYLICVAMITSCTHPTKQVIAEGMYEVTGDSVTVRELTWEGGLAKACRNPRTKRALLGKLAHFGGGRGILYEISVELWVER